MEENKELEQTVEKSENQLEFEKKFEDNFGITLDDYVSDSLEADNLARIKDVYLYAKQHNLTMQEVREEIKEKKSKLSSMNRLFASTYQADVLEKWCKEICEDKDGLKKLYNRLKNVIDANKNAQN